MTKKALWLSGGATRGSFQMGAIKFLYEQHGFRPDIILSVMSLTYEPGTARHHAPLRQAHRRAQNAYGTLKAAAAGPRAPRSRTSRRRLVIVPTYLIAAMTGRLPRCSQRESPGEPEAHPAATAPKCAHCLRASSCRT
jgi:hypothetical protein